MPLNGFTVGKDISTNINTQSGPLVLALITGFDSKPEYVKKKVKGLDGVTRHVNFPDGWVGSFEVERQDSTLDDYTASWEAGYYAGQNNDTGSITESITEVAGNTTQWQYVGVQLLLDEAGKFSGDDTVKQKVSFTAQQRIKLA